MSEGEIEKKVREALALIKDPDPYGFSTTCDLTKMGKILKSLLPAPEF